ncbi:adult cuticle protein 1-like [Toxorhynchites rutilus septentrionalis]|uniref:adult cuticle protein 1-like n=1 Tax=Toxorhynchites rutilus septentrionalis TaxID=329112 RepID=UPI00247AD0A8|nr:adult cuticle protein 1-like [Toxorhynchites rutilus septentrionalis]
MKCIIVAVILAMAIATEAGVVPWGWPHAAGLPAAVPVAEWPGAHGWGAHGWGAPGWQLAGAWPAAVPALHAAAPLLAVPHAPVASVAHHAGVVPGATSVTANRGSVHVAPLPGHAISQQQLNLAPAPGTI